MTSNQSDFRVRLTLNESRFAAAKTIDFISVDSQLRYMYLILGGGFVVVLLCKIVFLLQKRVERNLSRSKLRNTAQNFYSPGNIRFENCVSDQKI